MKYLLLYLVLINLFAVFMTISDKKRSKKGKWRVKEISLLIVSALGGSVFMYITMKAIRHKTKKTKFMVGIPLIFALQVILSAAFLYLHFYAGFM